MPISETLQAQYDHTWKMLKEGIDLCPDDQWRVVVEDSFFVPVRIVFHVVQTIDFYAGSSSEEFDWEAFGFDWEESAPEQLPDKSAVLEYLEQVQEKLVFYLSSTGDAKLQDSDRDFAPWFASPLARLIYGLRHSHHHIGQLSLDLQRRGAPEITW